MIHANTYDMRHWCDDVLDGDTLAHGSRDEPQKDLSEVTCEECLRTLSKVGFTADQRLTTLHSEKRARERKPLVIRIEYVGNPKYVKITAYKYYTGTWEEEFRWIGDDIKRAIKNMRENEGEL